MLVTPTDATKKVCPFALPAAICVAPIAVGSPMIIPAAPMCRADECMGWRWGDREPAKFFVKKNDGPEEEWNWNPQGQKGYEEYTCRVFHGERKGYCGAFGATR
jgi:hypothetical protein